MNVVPTDVKTKFVRGRDQNAWVVARMEALEGKGASTRFIWTGPDGKVFRDVPLVLLEAHGAYSVYDYVPLTTLTTGAWRAKVTFEGIPLGEASFTVE